MYYTTIWIEGEDRLNDFCQRRFQERPRFVETVGRVGTAKVYMVYKWREDRKRYVDMYLLFMEHPKGTVGDIAEKRLMTYEEIRADKTSILAE